MYDYIKASLVDFILLSVCFIIHFLFIGKVGNFFLLQHLLARMHIQSVKCYQTEITGRYQLNLS